MVSFAAFQIAVVLKISYRVLVNHSALVTTAKVLKRVLSAQSAYYSNIYYRNFADIKRMFRLGEGKNMPRTACCGQPRHKKCGKNYNGPWQRTRTRVRNVATRSGEDPCDPVTEARMNDRMGLYKRVVSKDISQ